jgi:hypothetical protein
MRSFDAGGFETAAEVEVLGFQFGDTLPDLQFGHLLSAGLLNEHGVLFPQP